MNIGLWKKCNEIFHPEDPLAWRILADGANCHGDPVCPEGWEDRVDKRDEFLVASLQDRFKVFFGYIWMFFFRVFNFFFLLLFFFFLFRRSVSFRITRSPCALPARTSTSFGIQQSTKLNQGFFQAHSS